MATIYYGDGVTTPNGNWNDSVKFTVSGVTVTPTAGATYTNNGQTYTVNSASISGGSGTINCAGTGFPSASGTLTKTSGTGDATISFSSKSDLNWYSALGGTTSKGGLLPGTYLGRIPNAGTDSVLINGGAITTGPSAFNYSSATYTGTITIPGNGNYIGGSTSSHYSGTITMRNLSTTSSTQPGIQGGTWDGTVGVTQTGSGGFAWIGGNAVFSATSVITTGMTMDGTSAGAMRNFDAMYFSGSVQIKGKIINNGMRIAAGSSVSITGIIVWSQAKPTSWTLGITINVANGYGNMSFRGYFPGGTYSPTFTATLSWSGNQPVITWTDSLGNSYGTIPPPGDPGFAVDGGTYSPTITYKNFPDILGTGLL